MGHRVGPQGCKGHSRQNRNDHPARIARTLGTRAARFLPWDRLPQAKNGTPQPARVDGGRRGCGQRAPGQRSLFCSNFLP